MKTKSLPGSLIIIIAMTVLFATQSCHNRYDEGSEEGHYDTVQTRTNDHTMTNQQHDGLDKAKTDTITTVDSTSSQ